MQTFLPDPSFHTSAYCLDNKRLGKQRVEVLQLLKCLNGGPGTPWYNHPAAQMWKGYEEALAWYGRAVCQEWKKRGFQDTCEEKILEFGGKYHPTRLPWWIGNPDFHRAHQSNLVRKFPEFYGVIYEDVPNDLPYLWPDPTTPGDFRLV